MIKKPTEDPCEIFFGVDYSGSAPVVLVCRKPGVLVQGPGLPAFGIVMCPDCQARWEAKNGQETN